VANEGPSNASKAPESQIASTAEREANVPAANERGPLPAVGQSKKDEVALPVREKGTSHPPHNDVFTAGGADKNTHIEQPATAPVAESSPRNPATERPPAADKTATVASSKKVARNDQNRSTKTESTKMTGFKDTKAAGESSKPVSSQVEPTAKDDAALQAGAAATAAGAAGTAAYAASKKDETRREPGMNHIRGDSILADIGQVQETTAVPFTAGPKQAALPARKKSDRQTIPAVAAAPDVSPHVKRPHQNAPFLPQDGEQPPKKPRVNDHDVTPSELAVPGRFPTPSITESTTSATDNIGALGATETTTSQSKSAVPAVAGLTGVESVKTTKPQAPSSAAVAEPASTFTSTQKTGPSPLSAGQAAPSPVAVAASNDNKKTVDPGVSFNDPVTAKKTASGSVLNTSTGPPTSQTTEHAEPGLPVAAQNLDGSSRPINPAAALASKEAVNDKIANPPGTKAATASAPKPQETPTTQLLTDAANDEPRSTGPENSTAKKGGFMAWVKRVFKSDKSEKAAPVTNGH
jgi:hypothetical protein